MNKYGMILLFMAAAGCNSAVPAENGHSHDDAEHTSGVIQVTRFTDTHEFFIEYDRLMEGHPSAFLIHVTKLATYAPVRTGSLIMHSEHSKLTIAGPESPGIYHAEFESGVSGHGDLLFILSDEAPADTLRLEVEVSGHDHGGERSETAHYGNEGSDEGPGTQGEITFLKEQAWKSDFMVEKVKLLPFSSVIHTGGTLEAVAGEKKHLPSLTDGILMFSNTDLVMGSWVEKGQPLFLISAGSLTGDNFEIRYKELLNELQKSREEYQRHKTLYHEGVVSKKQMVRSRTAYLNDSVRFHTLASQATVDGMVLRSPIDGYIHKLNVAEGQYVKQGQELVSISSNRKLLLRADVPMQHYGKLKDMVTANFRTSYSDSMYRVDALNGRLLARGSSVFENDRFIPVYFELENDGTLLEGAYAEVFLKSRTKDDCVVVPVGAILEEQGYQYVYLQVSGESFTKRPVTTGASDGIRIAILDGISPGERVVTRGVMLLKAASMVTGNTGHGHTH